MKKYYNIYEKYTFIHKIKNINLPIVVLTILISCLGFAMLYSAASGSFHPWSYAQILRFCFGFVLMIIIALVDIKLWYKYAYLFYGISLILLICVPIFGHISMGAQRWLTIGGFRIQPSELMKITLVLALSRFYTTNNLSQMLSLKAQLISITLIITPVALIIKQPDLGTAIFLLCVGFVVLWVAGTELWKFLTVGTIVIILMPIVWRHMHEYQKNRVLTFLYPERDPQGASYHIIQSKIALGSGAMYGKGFLHGTQAQLQFLPEKHTDFIFTLIGEEFGFVGTVTTISLFFLLILWCYSVSMRSNNNFGKILSAGIASSFFFYVFINTGMVMGILPVVGVPIPLVSYGGTVMISSLVAIGLVLNTFIYKKFGNDYVVGKRNR